MSDSDFRKMLKIETPVRPSDNHLDELAEFMAKRDPAHSKIPAGYTYLAQFVDHDISLDSLARRMPWENLDLSAVKNLRNPVFDLETIYGNEAEEDSPYLEANLPFLKLGQTSFDSTSKIQKPIAQDLPRNPAGAAEVPDKRSDENLLIAQTHVAFIKFHNAIASEIGGSADKTAIYKEARRTAIRHYQYLILRDLLPKIVRKSVLDDVLENGNRLYLPDAGDSFMPLEFSVAAFRMGHSMVRNKYNLNRIQKTNLSDLQAFTGNGSIIARTKKLPGDWLIDWNLFYNLTDWGNPPENFNFALKYNPEIASGLGNFLGAVGYKRASSVPALDLFRGRLFDLPTGQMAVRKLREILPDPHKPEIVPALKIKEFLPAGLEKVFGEETPLWFYFLAEARQFETEETLGTAGSRIVAEVFIELLKRSPHTILTSGAPTALNFPADGERFYGKADGAFTMAEMLNFIESKKSGFLNPLGS